MRTLLRVSRVAALLAATLSLPLVAQGWIDPIRPLPPNANGRIERLRSAVQVSITGRVARVSVEEWFRNRSEEHTSELQSQSNLVCRLLLEKKKKLRENTYIYRI